MNEPTLPLESTLAGLPPERDSQIDLIRDRLQTSSICTVVLDDDPTGTQTVCDVAVLTRWDVESLSREFASGSLLFYVLTNSRALPADEAIALGQQIGENLLAAASGCGRKFQVISRSDSTLRGHFPGEVDSLADAIGHPGAVRVLCPFFIEGGRYTIDDVHYAADGDTLIPCAMTPFAADAAFGYQNSNLVDWTIEKCGDSISRDQIHSLSLERLRNDSVDSITRELIELPAGSVLIVNAAATSDVETFVAASLAAAAQSAQTFVYRTAAGLVRSMAGQIASPLLTRNQLVGDDAPTAGLIVVGSYVPKTTAQWLRLVDEEDDLHTITIEIEDALADDSRQRAMKVAELISDRIRCQTNVAVCTSRQLKVTADPAESLVVGRRISRYLVDIVSSIEADLGWLIAKGGITSSDLATEALGCRRAEVMGQIAAGIPVWKMGDESKRPGMPYIVFPGNVGSADTLHQVYRVLA